MSPAAAVRRRGEREVERLNRGLFFERNTRTGFTSARLRYTHDGRKDETTLKCHTKTEARQAAVLFLADLSRGVRVEPSRLTCEALWVQMKVELDAQVASGDRKVRSVGPTFLPGR